MLLESIFIKGYIIPTLLLVFMFLFIFRKEIKKKPVIFYIIFTILTLMISKLFISKNLFSYPIKKIDPILMYFINIYKRGVLGYVLFLVVMFLGVIKKDKKFNLELISIRGQISIIASIASLCHLFIYGYAFIKKFLMDEKIDILYVFLFLTSFILLLILIPLFITSFIKIRKKMNPIKWKKLQSYAHIFYFLLFINVIFVFIRRITNPKFSINKVEGVSTIISLIVYVLLLFIYTYFLIKRNKKQDKI